MIVSRFKFVKTIISRLTVLYGQLSPKLRRQVLVLPLLMSASAFAEILSVGAIVPFLSILIGRDGIDDLGVISTLGAILSTDTEDGLLTFLFLCFVLLIISAGAIRYILSRATAWVNFSIAKEIDGKVFDYALSMTYEEYCNHNTSTTVSMMHKVDELTHALHSFLIMVGATFIVAAMLAALLFLSPKVVGLSVLSIGGTYLTVYLLVYRKVIQNSNIINTGFTKRAKIIQEALGGYREILLEGRQKVVSKYFRFSDGELRDAQANTAMAIYVPRYLVEAVGIIVIASLAMKSLFQGDLSETVPILGALAVASQRLLPLVQQIYQGFIHMANASQVLIDISDLLSVRMEPPPNESRELRPIKFKSNVTLKDVSFSYDGSNNHVLRGISLQIDRGITLGIMGVSGGGKSTLADLILGLLKPTSGGIYIDDQKLDDTNRRDWHASVSHVPQEIFLLDSTFAENIALGESLAEIDFQRVASSASAAQIHDFIESTSAGYLTSVGERGLKLSGGQRQRIAIARALYRRAKLIIFDEATSALDEHTEAMVCRSISALSSDITVLLISHRPNTLAKCDRVISIGPGGIREVSQHELISPSVENA